MAEEEVDKLRKIYSVLTDEEVEAWVASSDDLKLPGAGVTAAFRDAEVEFLQFSASGGGGTDDGDMDNMDENYDDIAISRLSELLSELLWRIVGGTLAVDIAVDYLASDQPFQKRLGDAGGDGRGAVSPLVELLCDTLWGVDAMVRGTVATNTLDLMEPLQQKQWDRLCAFVRRIRKDKLVPHKVLMGMLTEELLVGSEIISQPSLIRGKEVKSTLLARAMLRKNTEMAYKQHRFNLQREETEGFAKLLVLLGGVRDGSKVESEENMRRLIGYFDLDPNRSLDLTLDALESDPSNLGLLRLVSNFNRDSVPHVVGFKLRHYRHPFVAKVHRARVRDALNKKEMDLATYKEELEKITPRSLYVVVAMLLATGTMTLEGVLQHTSPGFISLAAAEKAYMADLENQLAKAGGRAVKLDCDGNLKMASASAGSDSSTKLGSMAPLASGSGYGGGGGGMGTLYGGRDRDRDSMRDAARDRDARRRSGDSVGMKANGSTGAGAGDGAGGGGGGDDDDASSPGKDNQLYGVLEALLDLRAWTVASDLLGRLAKSGVDPLRNASVREALKRLVKDALEGLSSRYPKPITLCPPGSRKGPATTASGARTPLMPPPAVMASDAEEAEAGEVTPQTLTKTASSRSNSSAANANQASSAVAVRVIPTPDLKLLQRLPGYGSGFATTDKLSEAVAVLAPLLKAFGPHLGRDPIMFAQVCRVLAAVNSRNPIPSAGKSKNGSSRGNSNSAAAKDKSNGNAAVSVDDKDPLKAFHSLFGLSPTEAKELYRRGEAEGGAGGEGGAKALSKELDRRKGAYIRVVLTVAPSLGMTHANPGMQGEVWHMLAELPYEDRFMLYGAWRGHGMEKHALGVKHAQYAVAEISAGAEISRLIKMLTSDNVKDMARKLGKSSHAHPLLFAEKVLNQLESYDNFISMVADSMRYLGITLALDCVAYTMVQHLCQSNRSFVSDSGLTLERWVSNLATFAGLLHRKHGETDCKPLFSWIVRALAEGGEPAMAAGKVLREVLHQAGGVQVLDGWSITQAQVDGKGGGEVLRQENASFGSTVKPVRKAKNFLQVGMEKAGASLPLLVLPAHQAEALLYEGGSLDDQMRGKPQPHLKVLGHRSDETHTTLLQAVEFVCSKLWVRNKCPSIETLLTKYSLEPRVVFHIWRPVINESLMKHWFPKTGTKTEKEQREEAVANRFIEGLESSIANLPIVPKSSPLTAKLVLVFWALSLSDVYIPTKKYAQVVTNMNEAKRRADSKLSKAENEEVLLSKAEKARYISERKTCPALAAKLDVEKAVQAAHVKRVKSKLREIKGSLFNDQHKMHKENVDAILEHLIGPRIGMGPEEAYFCSKFFNTLHAIEAPNFNSLTLYSRSFECLSSTLLCKTQCEAASLGFYLKDLLENVKEWRKPRNEAIFKMEAGTKHGFNIREEGTGGSKGKPPQMTHKEFVQTSGTWSMQLTKTLVAAAASEEFLLIKSGLILFNKLIETFPVSQHERKLLLEKLEPMTDRGNEPRDDIRVPCTRIVTQLKKQVAEAGPDPTSSTPAVAKPAAAAASGGGGGSNGRASSTAPTSRTVGGLNSRGRGAAPGAESRGSLSATARPYVPAPIPGAATASNSSSTAAVKRESQQQQQQQQQQRQQPAGASHAIKRDPPSAGGTLAAAALAAGAAAARAGGGGGGGGGGAVKRGRDGGAMASPPVGRPAKAPRVTEQGEITSEKAAAAAATGSTSSAAGTGGRGGLAASETKKPSTPVRDSKAVRKASPSSPSPSGASRSAAATTTAAAPTARPQASSSSSSSSGSKTAMRTAASSAATASPAPAATKTTLVGASRQSAARVSAREDAAAVGGAGGEASKQQQKLLLLCLARAHRLPVTALRGPRAVATGLP